METEEGKGRIQPGLSEIGDLCGWKGFVTNKPLQTVTEKGAPLSVPAEPEPNPNAVLKAPPQPRAQSRRQVPFVSRPYSSGRGARAESLCGRTVPAMGAG